jgi:hypothetical protein
MLLRDLKQAQLLAKARQQPALCFLSFSPHDVLQEVRETHFTDLTSRISLHIVQRGPLACIVCDQDAATIYVHQVLNHDETPREVFSLVCKHELLHLRIDPVEQDGMVVQHPPEFWELERSICPERNRAWAWIWTNLHACLKQKPRLERIDVLPNWPTVWRREKTDIETCMQIYGMTGKGPEIGW